MKVHNTTSDFLNWRKSVDINAVVGFIPTMGALHAGHLSLIELAKNSCDIVVVSIFVNPKQFSENEDFDTYPRKLSEDLKKLRPCAISSVFAPSVGDIYVDDKTKIEFNHPFAKILEGQSRPHFFPGVIDVVSRLFDIVNPTKAFFGRKDAQQLILIKKMVDVLKYNIKIIPGETIREKNGLAMSSRNEYLSSSQRDGAKIIWQSLKLAKSMLDGGVDSVQKIKKSIIRMLQQARGIQIDYVSVVEMENLLEVPDVITGDVLISVAVFFGDVRLIDNIFYKYY